MGVVAQPDPGPGKPKKAVGSKTNKLKPKAAGRKTSKPKQLTDDKLWWESTSAATIDADGWTVVKPKKRRTTAACSVMPMADRRSVLGKRLKVMFAH